MPKCMDLWFNFIEIVVCIIRIDIFFFFLRSLEKQTMATLSSLSSPAQILNTDFRLNVKLRSEFKCLNLDRPIFISVTVAQITPYYSHIQEQRELCDTTSVSLLKLTS